MMTPAVEKGRLPAVLVVDDAPFFRRLVVELLEGRGYPVVEAGDGEQALGVLARRDIAVVLTDIEMPGLSGPALLRRIKRLHPLVQVMIVSSHHDFEAARQVLRDGALDYLTKPIQEPDLFEALERGVKAYREARNAAVLRHEAQRRFSDLILLREIGETASSRDNLQFVFEKVLDSITAVLEVEIASVMLVDEDGLLRIGGARGLPAKVIETARVAPGEGISGHVLASGTAVLIDNLENDRRFAPCAGSERYRSGSLLSVPLRCRDKILGVINVNNKHSGRAFSAADRDLLGTVAHQTALAIENFKLVSSLRLQTRQLEEANQRLVSFNQTRSRLVCNLSHELNTPLTTILGFSDLILNFAEQIEAGDLRDYLGKIHRESRHMERLIAGMLRLFTFDSGQEEWRPAPVSLGEVIQGVLSEEQTRIAALQLQLQLQLAPEMEPLYADPGKVRLLVGSLVDNAIKFNRAGGVLSIQAQPRLVEGQNRVYLRVHNDGRSIPPEAEQDIFEQYTQLGDIDTDKPQGVGIGLAICKAIVSRMNGQIYLEPPAGEGTTMAVMLPAGDNYGVSRHGD
ncbi:hypothetical protein DESUT3_14590 [Desulfuromonas versatilis]|uniref:histidine kinase n=1 Tax=Desulfuromonas versatilis TaxID=2802975 RepID=A0ABN6DWH0_9BACT|nr:response regulator [Desulfuromonas versatilis]BCR04390.1 hypothetical protein DESUT3_14590 [Desulfuromonas versatilis]